MTNLKSFLTKPVPAWRALLGVAVAATYATAYMTSIAKIALTKQEIELRTAMLTKAPL